MATEYHVPVLLKETLHLLDPRRGKTYVDATLGGGGHAEAILKKLNGTGTLVGIDRDEAAILESQRRLAGSGKSFLPAHDNFINIAAVLKKLGLDRVDGILLDLGVSSRQLDESQRGFSIQKEGPLDMRMDATQGMSAKEVVNSFDEKELSAIIKGFGEERRAREIARFLVKERGIKPLSTTLQLTGAIAKALKGLPPKIIFDSTIRTFQALRIYVNDELNNLSKALKDSVDILNSGGRLIVISYHSLEDRIVKNKFREAATDCLCPPRAPVCTCGHKKRVRILTKRPIAPNEDEIMNNPRSRSAKLRAVERI